ncbi:MAG: acetylornithine deacetylase [Steroidobacteraceae bacterium]
MKAVDLHNPDSIELTRHLVSFDTVSRGTNLPLIEFVENWLRDLGVDSVRIHSDDGRKANLIATVGPMVEGGIVLSGHTDVVPVDGQAWSSDPFTPWIEHGRLYGRGTCDMKAFIGAVLAAIPKMQRLKRPVHLALSYDEEIGCLGAPRMIEKLKDLVPPPRAVVVGEPTSMQSVTGHKGLVTLQTTVIGYETHSSQTNRGVSAVMTAARLVNYLDGLTAHLHAESLSDSYEPPYSTINVGVIRGGTAINIVARECEFAWDIRNVYGSDGASILAQFDAFCRDEVLPEMRRRHAQTSIRTEILSTAPAFEVNPDSPAVELAQRLSGIPSTRKVSFAAEAGLFAAAAMPTVICGPGSIDQAHQPNEYISLEQIAAVDRFLENVIHFQSQVAV